MDTDHLTLSSIAKQYSDEEAAWLFLEEMRWQDGPVCPHCGAVDDAYYLTPKSGARSTRTGKVSYRRLWKCAACRQQFSVLVGTIFEDSKIPISKWLLAFHLLCAGKNGVSAPELSRMLDVCYKTAWFMAHRIRKALERSADGSDVLSGVVEADETDIGGRAHGKRGQGAANKTPVVRLVERNGEARSQVVTNVTGENIKDVLTRHAEPAETVLVTDSYPVYEKPGTEFAEHHTIDHTTKQYARWQDDLRVHTNTVEGYFSQLKRSLDGTYHHVSEKHLARYLTEFDYRYNTRKVKDGERMVRAVQQVAGKRLLYQESIASD
jgi:transposase-like protein